jgi:hypothetical protein
MKARFLGALLRPAVEVESFDAPGNGRLAVSGKWLPGGPQEQITLFWKVEVHFLMCLSGNGLCFAVENFVFIFS